MLMEKKNVYLIGGAIIVLAVILVVATMASAGPKWGVGDTKGDFKMGFNNVCDYPVNVKLTIRDGYFIKTYDFNLNAYGGDGGGWITNVYSDHSVYSRVDITVTEIGNEENTFKFEKSGASSIYEDSKEAKIMILDGHVSLTYIKP